MDVAVGVMGVDVVETSGIHYQTAGFGPRGLHADGVGYGDPRTVDQQAEVRVHVVRLHCRTAIEPINRTAIATRSRVAVSGVELIIVAQDAALSEHDGRRARLRARRDARRRARRGADHW